MGRSPGVVRNYCRKLLLRCSPDVWRTHIERWPVTADQVLEMDDKIRASCWG